MRDRLELVESKIGYQIQWYLGDDQEEGAALGDSMGITETIDRFVERVQAEMDSDAMQQFEHYVAELAACKSTGCLRNVSSGVLYWETKNEATVALRAARLAVKLYQANIPWPEWAKTAVANGWKAPKGWKP
jgi:hypothetical protein